MPRTHRSRLEQMRLYGIPVRDEDIHTLIDRLHRVGRAEDLELAMRLKRGISLGTTLLALSGNERDLLLNVLDHPPKGLVELRGVLAPTSVNGIASSSADDAPRRGQSKEAGFQRRR